MLENGKMDSNMEKEYEGENGQHVQNNNKKETNTTESLEGQTSNRKDKAPVNTILANNKYSLYKTLFIAIFLGRFNVSSVDEYCLSRT